MKLKHIVLLGLAILITFLLWFYFKPSTPLPDSCIISKLVVIKHERIMLAYSGDTVIKSYDISLGRQPIGAKEIQGDMKTPEGSYTIFDKNTNSEYHKNLGISFPNAKDLQHAKELGKPAGGLIKIHGLKNGRGYIGRFHLLYNWTQGCIAVTNEDIDELYKHTPIGTEIRLLP